MLDNLTLKQKIIVITIGVIASIGIIYYIYTNVGVDKNLNEEEILVETSEKVQNTIENKENEEIVIVHITGGVKVPGIVKLKEGARIEDAIEKAGGLTEDADISKINLAYILEDGMKIIIPKNSDIGDLNERDLITNEIGENIIESDKKEEKKDNDININKADENELSKLPGIGSSLASKIILYRKENGNFKNIEDIKNVNGIGDSKFEEIKKIICVK